LNISPKRFKRLIYLNNGYLICFSKQAKLGEIGLLVSFVSFSTNHWQLDSYEDCFPELHTDYLQAKPFSSIVQSCGVGSKMSDSDSNSDLSKIANSDTSSESLT